MAVAVYISNESGATEITLDAKATQEIVIVGHGIKGAQPVPVKIVSRTISGVKSYRVVGARYMVDGETL